MARILIVYGTTEGQTAKVAQHVADVARQQGHVVDVFHAAELDRDFALTRYDAAVLGASVHEGHFQRYLVRWAKEHVGWLVSHPGAFFAVCLAAASQHPEELVEAEAIMDRFAERTGWQPQTRTLVAGALRYSQYNWLKRALMKHIASKEGGDTDTSQDHEYTDWAAVTAWAGRFFQSLPATVPRSEQGA